MQTAIIFNHFEYIEYFVIEGDHRNLQNVYINSDECADEDCDKLNELFYNEDGDVIQTPVDINIFAEAIRQGAFVVECGFIP